MMKEMKIRNKMRLLVAISGLILLGSFVWTTSLFATVQVDAVNSDSTNGGSSITIPLTISGSNRLLLVGVSLTPDAEDNYVASVTWKNGTESLTRATPLGYTVNSDDARAEIWKLVAPSTGSYNVVVTFFTTLTKEAVAGAMSFTGVDQNDPLDDYTGGQGDDTTSANVDVLSTAGDLVFGVISCEYDDVVTDPSQDQRWNITVDQTRGAGSTETSSGATVATSWTLQAEPTPNNHWAIGGISIKPAPSGGTIDVWVTQGSDDAEEYKSDGSMYIGSSDLELAYEDGTTPQWIGMRFQNITVPQGSGIANAYVQFTADNTNSEGTNLTIYGQDVSTAPTFENTNSNISGRDRTSTTVNWEPAAWTGGERGVNQRTSDISSIIREIVGRGDWLSGNDLVIIIDGTGEREAESYEGATINHSDPTLAPMLHLDYDPTLIELSSFTAKPLNSAVLLEWTTETELDNEGFNLLRSEEEDGEYVKINRYFIPARGEAGFGAEYSYTDYDVENGVTYYYLLEDVDFYGKSTLHGPVSATPNDIILIWPPDWEPLDSDYSIFSWTSSGNFSYKVDVSTNPSFPDSTTLSFPNEGWTSNISFWLRPEEWEMILWKAQQSGGQLFWRLRAKSQDGQVVCSNWKKFVIDF
jgi:hypothetical protein